MKILELQPWNEKCLIQQRTQSWRVRESNKMNLFPPHNPSSPTLDLNSTNSYIDGLSRESVMLPRAIPSCMAIHFLDALFQALITYKLITSLSLFVDIIL